MSLWGVAVFELDSHPDHNKGPDPRSALVLRPIPFIDSNHTKSGLIWHVIMRLCIRVET